MTFVAIGALRVKICLGCSKEPSYVLVVKLEK